MLIFPGGINTLGGQLRIRWGAGGGSKKEIQKNYICIREGYDRMVECVNLLYEIKKMQPMTILFDFGFGEIMKKTQKVPIRPPLLRF